jgi:diguanylate cyclase (GGDEF)-like protein
MYVRTLQRGWWIIALTTLTALLLALLAAYNTTPQYRTKARFIIGPNPQLNEGGRDFVNTLQALDRRSIAATFAEVLDSPTVYQEASAALGIPGDVLQQYRFSTVVLPGANVLELSVTGPNPETAALLANAVGAKGLDYVTSLYQVWTVTPLDSAFPPPNPISPQPKRDAAVALVLGLLAGCGLAIVREQLRSPLAALRARAAIDGESGAFTRGHLLAKVDDLTHAGTPVALGLIQFDGLGDLIATLPRPAAQELLRRITTTLRTDLRGRDLVGRWNETAFGVVLPNTAVQPGFETVSRIAQHLAQQDIDGETVALQPRVGMIDVRAGETPEQIAQRAEAALEQARSDNKRTILAGAMASA